MILYEFRCEVCRRVFTELLEAPSGEVPCTCGAKARRLYSPPSIVVSFREGFHPGLDEYVGTQRELERKLAERGYARRR